MEKGEVTLVRHRYLPPLETIGAGALVTMVNQRNQLEEADSELDSLNDGVHHAHLALPYIVIASI